MLAVSWDTVRLFLHVLAATVWVGGQLTWRRWCRCYAGSAPTCRVMPRAASTRWPGLAFAVLVITGVWNIVAVRGEIGHDAGYRTTLIVKLAIVGVSGVTAFLHARARSTIGLAVFGALTGVSALAALFLGVLLAG